jgi:SAM-dependent methyltransferase
MVNLAYRNRETSPVRPEEAGRPEPGRGDFGFYLPLVMEAASVLDVGCGTGMLLRRARAEGHAGRLCGLDPAAAMLDVAREAGEGVEC